MVCIDRPKHRWRQGHALTRHKLFHSHPVFRIILRPGSHPYLCCCRYPVLRIREGVRYFQAEASLLRGICKQCYTGSATDLIDSSTTSGKCQPNPKITYVCRQVFIQCPVRGLSAHRIPSRELHLDLQKLNS